MLSRQEARRYYDRFGAKQDRQGWYEDPPLRRMVAHLELDGATLVVEFGCGTGRLAADLLDHHLPESATYLGVDASATMVGLASERLARFSGRAEVRQTDGEPRLPLDDDTADRVFSTYVLDLLSIDDIRAALADAFRVLRPGGLLGVVGLTKGTTLPSRLISGLWQLVHTVSPGTVGGCRPLELARQVDLDAWQLVHREVVIAGGIPSEVIALRRPELET